ncbi:MAG: hypothetical protein OWU84_01335 [Firmicutes bacterium]|nr:hypothetical protein [Bacillota bacterium]
MGGQRPPWHETRYVLKHQIPVRSWAEWDDATPPGFLEIDLVSHDGGAAHGDFAWTLDMVDILTGWTETAAVPNEWVERGLEAWPCWRVSRNRQIVPTYRR